MGSRMDNTTARQFFKIRKMDTLQSIASAQIVVLGIKQNFWKMKSSKQMNNIIATTVAHSLDDSTVDFSNNADITSCNFIKHLSENSSYIPEYLATVFPYTKSYS